MTLYKTPKATNPSESADRMQCAGKALEEMLISAKHQECLTVGVYESAKVMNVNPDSVAFCVLVTDKEYECNIALQIHFTLIQAFCFDNDIDIVRVNDLQHMAKIIGCPGMPCDLQDMHCVLVTSPNEQSWKDINLQKLSAYCEESRMCNEFLPVVTLPAR
ncbi:growth arrest and DNA damage-inducible protein GADD45 gamma-like [Polypterus senegalus]|uniref:growth arrest and DNA damage-inducible protein GADD45 gamma-like n=1 Tax=Polypterus senegalus TaxID=55291 RepID=UPI001965F609|nr:growth arrest and DNA damage-inducible protein GADD45 gamma-like [Polypterus senegalus]